MPKKCLNFNIVGMFQEKFLIGRFLAKQISQFSHETIFCTPLENWSYSCTPWKTFCRRSWCIHVDGVTSLTGAGADGEAVVLALIVRREEAEGRRQLKLLLIHGAVQLEPFKLPKRTWTTWWHQWLRMKKMRIAMHKRLMTLTTQ